MVTTGTPVRRWYVSDFTLREIKQLDAGSWFNPKFKGARVPTFQEAIDLVRGKAGLYPETKAPEVYGRFGFDMERLLVAALRKNRLGTRTAERNTPVIIQSFSPESLRKLSGMLNPKLPLVLLINEANADSLADASAGLGRGEAVCERNRSGESPARQGSGHASTRSRFERYALYLSLNEHGTLQNCKRRDELLLI